MGIIERMIYIGLSEVENVSHTVSTEALGEGGGVGDVIGRVLLWHQGDH